MSRGTVGPERSSHSLTVSGDDSGVVTRRICGTSQRRLLVGWYDHAGDLASGRVTHGRTCGTSVKRTRTLEYDIPWTTETALQGLVCAT